MFSKAIIIAAVIAYVEARFGQEQIPVAAISAVTSGGASGQAATIAGAAISDILGAANSCAKLQRADQVIQELGTGADAVKAAIGLVTAEKNTNPFANNNVQNVCNDPTLPASQQLRGITPLIDPAVDANGGVKALSEQTAATPLDATGKSVFDLLTDAGFGDLVQGQAAGANAAAGGNAAGGNAAAGNATAGGNGQASNNGQKGQTQKGQTQNGQTQNGQNQNGQTQNGQKGQKGQKGQAGNQGQAANNGQAAASSAAACGNGQAAATNAAAGAASTSAASSNATAGAAGAAGGAAAGGASSIAGADFGKCTPTIIFEGGLGGRPATEFTFQIADTTARGGQQEALNPNIITNALCNQLTNVCGANAAAKSACEDGKAKVQALGTRDKNTADVFNEAVGFAGAVTNPDGGPADAPAKAAANAKRSVAFRA